jgi:hypothetical protein
MIVTEEEAKTKRCQESYPAASGLSPDGAVYASGWHHPPPPAPAGATGTAVHTAPINCIGSACMAWRWQKLPDWALDKEGLPIKPSRGFCGKAGRAD